MEKAGNAPICSPAQTAEVIPWGSRKQFGVNQN